jgi:hypothetical protein
MGTAKRPFPESRYLIVAAWILLACPARLFAAFVLPGWDTSEITSSHAGAVGFNKGPGSMSVSDLTYSSLIVTPISSGSPPAISPLFDFRSTVLHFEKIPTSVVDDTLRTLTVFPVAINLGALFTLRCDNPAWIHGIRASEQLASDLRDISSEDFSTVVTGFSGYRFSDRFIFGAGIGIELIDDKVRIHPGIGIDWTIHDELRLLVCGRDWSLAYAPQGRWEYSIRGESTDEIWNLKDKGGEALSLRVSSYHVGMFGSRRLTDQCRFEVGIGATTGNEIHLRDSFGKSVVKEGLHVGLFGQIGLKIRSW